MTGKTIRDRREEAINFVAAQMDALRFSASHREETIQLTREAINAKSDDRRASYAFDDTLSKNAIDPSISLPMEKLSWMQGELVRSGNLKAAFDLQTITAPNIRAEAAKRATR